MRSVGTHNKTKVVDDVPYFPGKVQKSRLMAAVKIRVDDINRESDEEDSRGRLCLSRQVLCDTRDKYNASTGKRSASR